MHWYLQRYGSGSTFLGALLHFFCPDSVAVRTDKGNSLTRSLGCWEGSARLRRPHSGMLQLGAMLVIIVGRHIVL